MLDADYPALFRAADTNSSEAQAGFLKRTRARLLLLVLAAAMGSLQWQVGDSETDVAAVVGAAAFVTAALIEINLLTTKPERAWYDGRAAAESTKTLTWRYAVGGRPFGLRDCASTAEADNLFLTRLGQVVDEVKRAGLTAPADASHQITGAMRKLRASPLEARMRAYETGRIEDQRSWYAANAKKNSDRAMLWSSGLLLVEVVGALGAILRATGVIELDLLGLAGAIVAAAAAWVQTKQHQSIARAYAVASHELAAIASRASLAKTEEAWAKFVDQSEEAVSREHTLWRASHS